MQKACFVSDITDVVCLHFRETEQVKERRKLSWKDIPGPLQGE